jgi:hypothetical protein
MSPGLLIHPKGWAREAWIARHCRAGSKFVCGRLRYSRAKVMEHKEPDGRGQVGMQPPDIDVGDKAGERSLVFSPDLLEAVPKIIFEADTGLVPGNYDRPFDERGMHRRLLCWAARFSPTFGTAPPIVQRTARNFMTQTTSCKQATPILNGLTSQPVSD